MASNESFNVHSSKKVYGILTLVWMIVFVLLVGAIIVGFGLMNNVSEFIILIIGGVIATASIATFIRINDDTIIISSAVPLIAKR